jgi:DNA invertase Pin-like site-specific DNA recombinase
VPPSDAVRQVALFGIPEPRRLGRRPDDPCRARESPARCLELEKALAACKKLKAKLVIAKLDRLSRNLAFIAALMESGVEFVAVDIPHANKLTIHILAAVAQHEREMISERTRGRQEARPTPGHRVAPTR